MTEKSQNTVKSDTSGNTDKSDTTDIIASVRTFVSEAVKSDTSDLSAYVGGDRKFRRVTRDTVQSEMEGYLRKNDLSTAQSYLSLKSRLEATGPDKSDTVDITAVVAQRVANYLEAARLLTSGEILPEGVTKSDMPDSLDKLHYVLPSPTEAAKRLASTKVGRKTKEHDIQAFIARVYNESGHVGQFMKVRDIRARIAKFHDESCSCGSKVDSGWDGRISAALFGKNPPKGLEPIAVGHVRYAELKAKGAVMTDSSVTPAKSDTSDTSEESDTPDADA